MVFMRGHQSSYEAWVQAGAKGWGFDDLLPFLKRAEHTEGRDPALRGQDGPLRVAPARLRHPVATAGLAAAAELGHPTATDISGGQSEGFGWPDLTIADGRRQSAADAYLTPVLGRNNLDVVTDALVHRLTVRDGRCTGVEYSVGPEMFTAVSRAEVVLSAGTVGSPLLLLRSGIGPRAQLRDFGIDVLLDLPGVGQNLIDHPQTTVVYSAARPIPPGVNNHAEALGQIRSDPTLDAPDLQILFIDVPLRAPGLAGPDQGYAIGVTPMLPRSRGSVQLTGPQPDAAPRLDPNFLADPHDADVMVAGLRIARAIGRSTALASWRGAEALPGPQVPDDDASLRAYLGTNLRTYHHPVGTCRMGMDDLAVVDTDLRLHGLSGLRVVDASVMPTIPSANTNATVYAIAERAAALLQSRWS
jgi:choline dehydrogenase